MSNKEIIFSEIFKNNKLEHFCLKKEWYRKKNILNIYNLILEETFFLDTYLNITLRERIFYLENNFNKTQLCPYCKQKKLIFRNNLLNFTTTCSSPECISSLKKDQTTFQHKTMSKEVKEARGKKISEWQSRPTEEKYGKEAADKIAKASREFRLGKTYEELYGETKAREEKKKRKEGFEGAKNPMKNKTTKDIVTQKGKLTRSTSEYKEKIDKIRLISGPKQGATLKRKILSGEYTPNPINYRRNHFLCLKTEKGEKKFRSSWEAAFWVLNQHLIYEKIRIPYLYEDKKHIYIVDFVDENKKILYEVKPSKYAAEPKVLEKTSAAIKWCKNNNYTFEIITEQWLKENLKKINFDLYQDLKPLLIQYLRK